MYGSLKTLSVALCASGSIVQAQYELSVVAMSGDDAPAGPGVFDWLGPSSDGRVIMAENGMAYFFAYVDSPIVAGDYEGIFAATSSGIQKIVQVGDPVSNRDNIFLYGIDDEFVVNSSGAVAFNGSYSSNSDGLYFIAPGNDAVVIGEKGEPAPGGGDYVRLAFGSRSHALNNANEVAYQAWTTLGPNRYGIFHWADNLTTPVALEGDSVPGRPDEFITFSRRPTICNDGTVIFAGEWTDWNDWDGLFAWNNGTMHTLAAPETPSPGHVGTTFGIRADFSYSASAAADNSVAVYSYHDDFLDTLYFSASTNGLDHIPFRDSCVPGFGCGFVVPDIQTALAVNEQGQFVGTFSWYNLEEDYDGLLIRSGNSIVARSLANTSLSKGGILAEGRVASAWAINDSGTIAFQHPIDLIPDDSACCFDTGLFAMDGNGNFVELIRNGDSFAGGIVDDIHLTGTGNENYLSESQNGDGINNSGQIGFWFQLEDGRHGIAIASPFADCPADTNNDGQLTPADFTAWINAFNNNLPECDQNGDGACTPTDFTAWINNYNAGC
ncbi:MAG: hypothetical protein Phyf2KO_25130 [Phycisphaerales bacterium]